MSDVLPPSRPATSNLKTIGAAAIFLIGLVMCVLGLFGGELDVALFWGGVASLPVMAQQMRAE